MDEDHYDTPWEYLKRPESVHLSSNSLRLSTSGHQVKSGTSPLPQSPSFNNELVLVGYSPNEVKRSSCIALPRRRNDTKIEEDTLLEKNIDRVEAEKRLEGQSPGDFLLRSRGEGSAALSLCGSSGILHIKLERKGTKWTIGEGPTFPSILCAINYYKRHPLPIRGAEHLCLAQSLNNHHIRI